MTTPNTPPPDDDTQDDDGSSRPDGGPGVELGTAEGDRAGGTFEPEEDPTAER